MKTTLLRGVLFALFFATASAQSYTFSTLAGTAGQAGSADGTGSDARFSKPSSVAVDGSGNLYVADTENHTIRKITAAGVVTTLSGAAGQLGSTDGAGAVARFNRPQGVAVDGTGNVYVADTGNHTIRKITADGTVSTLAGAVGQTGNTDGPGSTARFTVPIGLAVDPTGTIYVVDRSGNWDGKDRLRKITPSGEVSTLPGPDLLQPMAVAVDRAGVIYVADLGEGYLERTRIRKVTAVGTAELVPELTRYVSYGVGLAVDALGNVFVAEDGTGLIDEIPPQGGITVIGGILMGIQNGKDGPGLSASFNQPESVAVDSAGNLYITDTGNHTIRKGVPLSNIAPLSDLSTVASTQFVTSGHSTSLAVPPGISGSIRWQILNNDTGWSDLTDNAQYSGTQSGRLVIAKVTSDTTYRFVATPSGGTPVASASYSLAVQNNILPHPTGLATTGHNVYVTDASLNSISQLDAYPYGSDVYLLAGSISGRVGAEDGTGVDAHFNQPGGICAASDGTLTVADTANGTIRRVALSGKVTTFAGSAATRGNVDATGTAATFSSPRGVAQDSSGTIYVADALNHTIRKITPDGAVSTFAGKAGAPGATDGIGADARFNNPCGLSVDASGNVYVSDTTNNTIRKITPAGNVTTLAGLFGVAGFDDGAGIDARFNRPMGMTQDASGNLYVTDTGNSTIRKISPNGTVSTLAGLPTIAGITDGKGTDALFNQPEAICLITYYAQPMLIVADTGNATIRTVTMDGTVTTIDLYFGGLLNPVTTPPSPSPTPPPAPPPEKDATSSSGGGSLDGWLVCLLGALVLARWCVPRPIAASLAQ